MQRLASVTPALAALVALAVGWFVGARFYDDAYITLRYARSLAAGQGFVFNPGEHVLGTTTPLFALLLAAAHWCTGLDLERLACAASLAGHAATAALVVMLGRCCGSPGIGLLGGVLYAAAPLAIDAAVGGMESTLFAAVTLAALFPLLSRTKAKNTLREPQGERTAAMGFGRGSAHAEALEAWGGVFQQSARTRTWQSVFAAMAMLLRPEGVLVALLRCGAAGRDGWRSAVRATTTIAVCTLPWWAFAVWYFGSPIPQSLAAKWAAAGLHGPWRAVEYFAYTLVGLPFSAPFPMRMLAGRPVFGTQMAVNLPWPASLAVRYGMVLAATALLTVLVIAGGVTLWRRQHGATWVLLFAALYCAAYGIADPQIFEWYLLPPLPILLLAFLAGGASVVQLAVHSPRWRRRIIVGLSAGLLLCSAYQLRLQPQRGYNTREVAYRKAVRMLGPPGQDAATVIGALEVGVIGYASRARVTDYFGLVSPSLFGGGLATMIDRDHPDYFILHDALAQGLGLFEHPRFRAEYAKIAVIPAGAGLLHAEIQIWQRASP